MERDRWLYCFDTEDSILPDFDRPVPGGRRRVDEAQLFRDLGEERGEVQVEERKRGRAGVPAREEVADWETRPVEEVEQEEQEEVRDFQGEDQAEYQSFLDSLD